MNKIKRDLNYQYVRQLFDYNATSGNLIWITKRQRINVGDIAGSLDKNNGYYTVRIDGKLYKNHRIIWLWYYGYNPENIIDHINRIRIDNRIINLREVSPSCNSINSKISISNTTGVKGVYQDVSGKYVAQIKKNKVDYYLGIYDSLFDAVLARWKGETQYHKQTCNPNSSARKYLENTGYFGNKMTLDN